MTLYYDSDSNHVHLMSAVETNIKICNNGLPAMVKFKVSVWT